MSTSSELTVVTEQVLAQQKENTHYVQGRDVHEKWFNKDSVVTTRRKQAQNQKRWIASSQRRIQLFLPHSSTARTVTSLTLKPPSNSLWQSETTASAPKANAFLSPCEKKTSHNGAKAKQPSTIELPHCTLFFRTNVQSCPCLYPHQQSMLISSNVACAS